MSGLDGCTTYYDGSPTSSTLFPYPRADSTSDPMPRTPTSMPTLQADQTESPGLAGPFATAGFGIVMKQAQTTAAKAVFTRLQSYLPGIPSPSGLWNGAGETASAYYSGASSMAKTGLGTAGQYAASAYSATADWTGDAVHKGFDASMTYGACATGAMFEHPWMAIAALGATGAAAAGMYYMSRRDVEETTKSTKKSKEKVSAWETLSSILTRRAGFAGLI